MELKRLPFNTILFFFIVISKATFSQTISENYPLSAFIADSINYSKIEKVKCKWEIYTITFRLSKRGELNQIKFSDSIPDEFREELTRLLKLTSGKWDKTYIKRMGNKNLFFQPVLNELISNCVDRPFKVFYSGIDSSLDNELSIYKSISTTTTANLVSLSESFQKLLQMNSKYFEFLNCVLLPPCRIKDRKLKKYRE